MIADPAGVASVLDQIDAFTAPNGGQDDVDTGLIPSFLYGKSLGLPDGATMSSIMIFHGQPSEQPQSLMGFTKIPAVHSTLRTTTHHELAVELAVSNSTTEA